MNAKKITGAVFGTVFRIILTIAILFAIYRAAIMAYNFGYRIFADIPAALSPGVDRTVTITEDMDKKEIARSFEEEGLVDDWKLFWVQILLSEYKDDLQAGVYDLNNSMTSQEMLAVMATPKEEEKDGDMVINAVTNESEVETETGDGEKSSEIIDNAGEDSMVEEGTEGYDISEQDSEAAEE